MPTYTYECAKCEGVFCEVLKIHERKTPTGYPCKMCGKIGGIELITCQCPVTIAANPFKGLSGDHKWAMKQMKKRHPNSTIKDY